MHPNLNIFLTGGTGFIGQALVSRIRARDWNLKVLVRDPQSPAAQWIARQGGAASYGTAAAGSSQHVAAELLLRTSNVKATHVPYRGSGPMMNDLTANAVEAMITTLVEAGRRGLFSLSRRSALATASCIAAAVIATAARRPVPSPHARPLVPSPRRAAGSAWRAP